MVLGEKEVKEYQTLVKEVDQLAEKYLAEKTDINSAYARSRVEGMKKLRRSLKANVTPLQEAVEGMET